MRKLSILLIATAVIVFSASTVQANTINGSIGFAGTYTQSGGTLGDLSTATHMNITSVGIFSDTGDLLGATLVTFATPIGVNGNPPSLVGSTLWSVMVGLTTYTFTVSTESQPFTSATQLNLAGNGVISDGNPLDDTSGTWQLGFGKSGASFTFQATSASAPEPGTLALLGSGLLGLMGKLVSRRKR